MFPILIILTHDYSYENKYDQYMIHLVLPEYMYVIYVYKYKFI